MVIGAGYVGLEIAATLSRLGKKVTIIELLPHVMGGRYDTEYSKKIEEVLLSNGINLVLGKKAAKIGGEGKAEYIELEDGNRIETDAIILAAGVAPRTEIADAFGLETSRHGFIVDEYFRTSIEDIYAIGDCIQTASFLTGVPVPGKLGSNAAQMARILAMNLNGYTIPFKGVINPACTCVFDLNFCSAGFTEKDAEKEEIEVIIGKAENTDIYSNMPYCKKIWVKLIFRKEDKVLIGGEFLGPFNSSGFADCTAQLIYRGATFEDIVTMDFSTHPELTPNPANSFLMKSAQKVLQEYK